MQLGAKHVESPFIEFGQISTALYFSYFILIVPFITLIENSLVDLASQENQIITSNSFASENRVIRTYHTMINKNYSTVTGSNSEKPESESSIYNSLAHLTMWKERSIFIM